jgi:hypothetical protein
MQHINDAARLLRGERITGRWNSLSLTYAPEADLSLLRSEAGLPVRVEEDLTLEVQGVEVSLGRVVTEFPSASLKSTNVDDHIAVLEPAGSDVFERFISSPPPLVMDRPADNS